MEDLTAEVHRLQNALIDRQEETDELIKAAERRTEEAKEIAEGYKAELEESLRINKELLSKVDELYRQVAVLEQAHGLDRGKWERERQGLQSLIRKQAGLGS